MQKYLVKLGQKMLLQLQMGLYMKNDSDANQ